MIGFRLPRLRFEIRLIGMLSLLAVATVLLGAAALYLWDVAVVFRLCALVALVIFAAATASAIFHHIVRPLQTLSNIVSALRENEYSLRAREVGAGDALGDLAAQINELGGDLRVRRHRESETFALLERVVETMDLPVFAFNVERKLQLINPAALKMLQLPAEPLPRESADSLGLGELLACDENTVVALTLRGREGRWMVRRSKFYQDGAPHTLLLLSDVSGMLREQERQAWQRLIRVLAHEVNNSLTPIKSIAGSLRMRIQRAGPQEGRKAAGSSGIGLDPVDLEHGLAIVEERAESLNRFLQTYSQIAKLPAPVKTTFALTPLLERVCHLETRLRVTLDVRDDVELYADAAQMEQALINLMRNGVDAAVQAHAAPQTREAPRVSVFSAREDGAVRIAIEDNGEGLANSANLFTPFYTTKPGGTGIGLVLALQIVEAHGGALTLTNRIGARGCCAEVRLPIGSQD